MHRRRCLDDPTRLLLVVLCEVAFTSTESEHIALHMKGHESRGSGPVVADGLLYERNTFVYAKLSQTLKSCERIAVVG